MRTWKTKRKICRSRKTGRFSVKGKCGAFKRQVVKVLKHGTLFG